MTAARPSTHSRIAPRSATGAKALQDGPALRGRTGSAKAWSTFWLEQGGASRCLADLQSDARRTLDDQWRSFASRLAPTSRVLDVGCGAGAVARTLLAARELLRIIGIDCASIPSQPDARFAILSRTWMEALPFADAHFDAAVSQFGVEYGRTDEAARELARVLAPGAPFLFLVHHSQSSIVRHNLARNQGVRALVGDQVRAAFMSAAGSELDRQIAPVLHRHPEEMIVAQVAEALHARLGRSQAERAAIWDAVVEALAPELEILDALDACRVSPEGLDPWLVCFREGFEIRTATVLRPASGAPIAWRVEGWRRTSGALC